MSLKTSIGLNNDWGQDHGAWQVIKHLYTEADVPVVEKSLDFNKTSQQHFENAKELIKLRKQGVLIIGSGNIVHNLRLVDWQNLETHGFANDWAREAQIKINNLILDGDQSSLIRYKSIDIEIKKSNSYFRTLFTTLIHTCFTQRKRRNNFV